MFCISNKTSLALNQSSYSNLTFGLKVTSHSNFNASLKTASGRFFMLYYISFCYLMLLNMLLPTANRSPQLYYHTWTGRTSDSPAMRRTSTCSAERLKLITALLSLLCLILTVELYPVPSEVFKLYRRSCRKRQIQVPWDE